MARWTGDLVREISSEMDDDVLRRRFLQATGAGATAAIAGCFGIGDDGADDGDGDGGPSGEVHWLMDYNSDAWQDRWADLKEQYEEEHPDVTIEMEYVGFQGRGGQRLQQLIQAGDPPELFQGTLPQMGLVIGDGQAIHVNDVNDNIRDFYDDDIKLIHTAQLGGTAEWLVPHGWQTINDTNYRRDIYEQLSLDVPETWDELLNNAEVIDNDGSIDARGYALAGQKTGKSSSEFDSLFRSAGGYYYEEVGGEIEVWFPEDIAIETLEFMNQLAQYSVDPSQMSWGPTIKSWLGGRMGQCLFVSAWLADVAISSGNTDLGLNTGIELVPTPQAGDDPLDRGLVVIDGTPIIKGSNVEAAKDWLTWLYAEDVERAANNNLMNMRLLPSTDALFNSDPYQNSEEMTQNDGYMAEQQEQVRAIAEEKSHPDRPTSPATNYVQRFPILNEMVNNVVVVGQTPQEAVTEAKDRFETRLQEGKERTQDISVDYQG